MTLEEVRGKKWEKHKKKREKREKCKWRRGAKATEVGGRKGRG